MNEVATQKGPQAVQATTEERRYVSPDVDIFENKDGYILKAEMPGVNKSGLEITLDANTLTLLGHRADQLPKGQPVYRESSQVHYRRVFELDPAIDTSKINARMDHGVLTLELPKADKVKPRKISVTS